MGRVLTDGVGLEFAIETTQGVLPGTPTWKSTEPNEITSFGPIVEQVSREPISRSRQRRKGVVVDLDSPVEFACDLTREAVEDFVEGFIYSSSRFPYSGATSRRGPISAGVNFETLVADDNVGGDRFTHTAIATAMTTDRLVFARGFTNAANNGLHVIAAGSTTTVTRVDASTLVDETPAEASGASIEICGQRYAATQLALTNFNATTATVTLTRTAGADFTTLGLSPGQLIHVGGLVAGRQFNAGGKGYGRIVSITATVIELDKISSGIIANDTGADDSVDLLFGSFTRNVATTDAEYLNRFYQFQLTQPGLGPVDQIMYEYAKGNAANEMTVELPLTDKGTLSFSFVGLDTEPATLTPKTNGATPIQPTQTAAFGTASDFARLRLVKQDETILTTCLKDITLSLNNQTSPEKCLGTLGASFTNQGTFLVDLDASALFTSAEIINAIRNNTTLEFDLVVRNTDGAIGIDIPSLTLGDGAREFPQHESVLVSLAGAAFQDPVLGYSVGISLIPTVPQS